MVFSPLGWKVSRSLLGRFFRHLTEFRAISIMCILIYLQNYNLKVRSPLGWKYTRSVLTTFLHIFSFKDALSEQTCIYLIIHHKCWNISKNIRARAIKLRHGFDQNRNLHRLMIIIHSQSEYLVALWRLLFLKHQHSGRKPNDKQIWKSQLKSPSSKSR